MKGSSKHEWQDKTNFGLHEEGFLYWELHETDVTPKKFTRDICDTLGIELTDVGAHAILSGITNFVDGITSVARGRVNKRYIKVLLVGDDTTAGREESGENTGVGEEEGANDGKQ